MEDEHLRCSPAGSPRALPFKEHSGPFEGLPWVAQMVKHLSAMQETPVQSLGWEDPLEKEMAAHSSTFAWKIPWMEEPGGLQSMGWQRVGHNWATSLLGGSMGKESTYNAGDTGNINLICRWGRAPGGGHGNSFQYSCLENPKDRGAWWATVHKVSKSSTWLKHLSMHACRNFWR